MQVPSVSNGLVGAAAGGADRDMDPSGATPHWRRQNAQDEERGVARLLNPFDGPGTRRPKNLLMGPDAAWAMGRRSLAAGRS